MENEIIIRPTFVFRDYFRVTLSLYFKKLKYLLMLPAMAAMLIFSNYINPGHFDETLKDFTPMLILFICFPFIMFLAIRTTIKKMLSNPKLKEDIMFILNPEYFEEKGESFNIKYFWKEIFQVVEKKEWFLVYLNKKKTHILRKEDLIGNQYNELKTLFNSLPLLKKKLF